MNSNSHQNFALISSGKLHLKNKWARILRCLLLTDTTLSINVDMPTDKPTFSRKSILHSKPEDKGTFWASKLLHSSLFHYTWTPVSFKYLYILRILNLQLYMMDTEPSAVSRVSLQCHIFLMDQVSQLGIGIDQKFFSFMQCVSIHFTQSLSCFIDKVQH